MELESSQTPFTSRFENVTVQTGDSTASVGTQWEAVQLSPSAAAAQLRSPALAAFLPAAAALCEAALQQNELADVLPPDFAELGEEDQGLGDASGAARAVGPGSIGSPSAEGLVEHAVLTEGTRGRGRAVRAVHWHPSRRGVLAVAYAPAGAPPALDGRPALGRVLVWRAREAVAPEAVLEAPGEVLALAWHPSQPEVLAGGCATGQVLLWHLGQAVAAAAASAAAPRLAGLASGKLEAAAGGEGEGEGSVSRDEGGGGGGGGGGASGVAHPALAPALVSSVEASHQAPVADLHWLPGAVVTRDGRFDAVALPPRPATALEAAPVPALLPHPDCSLFATTASDGCVLVWDHRGGGRPRRGGGVAATAGAAAEVGGEVPGWRPAIALSAQGGGGQPLLATRLCVDVRAPRGGVFLLASLEGELARVEAEAFTLERKVCRRRRRRCRLWLWRCCCPRKQRSWRAAG